MLCANSANMLIATYGVHKSAKLWVPVNTKLDVATIDYILRHAEVACVVVDVAIRAQPDMDEMLQALGVPLIMTSADVSDAAAPGTTTLAQALQGQPETLPVCDIPGEHPALIMYTSGTTGDPKGAVHTHASVTRAALGNLVDFDFCHTDVMSGVLPMFHCAQHVLVASACAAGASLVVARAFIPGEIAALLTREKLTVLVGLPMMYGALLADKTFAAPDYSSMRLCFYAMVAMPGPMIAQIAKVMGPNIMLGTGQTEIYPVTMSFRPLDNPGREANYWGISGTVCETAVMDDEGRLLPADEVGEIVHHGPNVMLGYFKDPEATEAAQRLGWHHTGYLSMFDAGGQMLFLDRKNDMI